MPKVIAIVEDEPEIRANYVDALRRHGYEVRAYSDRETAADAFSRGLPDLAILDIGLADEPEGGYELCRSLRAASALLPIIFLTARDTDLDVVSGLRLGADDYVSKNVSLPQLLARVGALIRRAGAERAAAPSGEQIVHGALRVDTDRLAVWWREQPVPLTVTEFWMLCALARHPGHVKSRDQLMDAANAVVDLSTVTSHIKRIRRKFSQVDASFECIDTVYGMGYRWVCAK